MPVLLNGAGIYSCILVPASSSRMAKTQSCSVALPLTISSARARQVGAPQVPQSSPGRRAIISVIFDIIAMASETLSASLRTDEPSSGRCQLIVSGTSSPAR